MEEAVRFTCKDKRLYGVLHIPDEMPDHSTLVIIVNGGAQMRTGSHRLYVQLSRFLCEHNWPSLRFDYEGMGDSEGDFVGFQYAEHSISAAMEFLRRRFTDNINFIFWSLCDGAAAVALYAADHEENVKGLILCNPFVATEEGLARSTFRHYYLKRVFNIDFLRKLVLFEVDWRDTVNSLLVYLKNAQPGLSNICRKTLRPEKTLPYKVIKSLSYFTHPIRIILSTDDLVASNFQDQLKKNKRLKKDYQSKKITNDFIEGADHTFINPAAKEKMFAITMKALKEISSSTSEERFRSP